MDSNERREVMVRLLDSIEREIVEVSEVFERGVSSNIYS